LGAEPRFQLFQKGYKNGGGQGPPACHPWGGGDRVTQKGVQQEHVVKGRRAGFGKHRFGKEKERNHTPDCLARRKRKKKSASQGDSRGSFMLGEKKKKQTLKQHTGKEGNQLQNTAKKIQKSGGLILRRKVEFFDPIQDFFIGGQRGQRLVKKIGRICGGGVLRRVLRGSGGKAT